MLAAALAALLLAANDPAPAVNATPTAREQAAARALCRDFEVPKEEFPACVRSMLRDSPERRIFGEAYPWAHTLIDPNGWTVRVAAADKVNLTKAAGGPPAMPRAWLRTENREEADPNPYLSGLWLYEFDCAGERMRNLQSTLYAANNLKGEAQTVTLDTPKWEYPNPNSLGDVLMRELCPPAQQASAAQPLVHPDPR